MSFNPVTEKYISLATFRKNGGEVRTPVWIVGEHNELYVFSESKAGKVKRIRNNGKIAIAPCDVRGKLKEDVWLEGTGEIVTDAEKHKRIYQLFDIKYGWQMRLLNFIAKLNGRYNKRAVLLLKIVAKNSC